MSDIDFDSKNLCTDSSKKNTPLDVKTHFEILNEFKDLSQDFGRESLGIFDINNSDFGRESLFLLNNELGRESLGIINLNNLDVGRESIGITNIKTYDFLLSNVNLPEIPKFKNTEKNTPSATVLQPPQTQTGVDTFTSSRDDLPEVFISSTNDSSSSVTSVLNTAFLGRLSSVSSNASSLYLSFNSASLENSLPSRISVSTSGHLDTLNEAFEDTSEFIKRMLKVKSLVSSPLFRKIEESNSHRRIHSLPSSLVPKNRDDYEKDLTFGIKNLEEKLDKTSTNVEKDVCAEDAFNDSVFIEGKHIASRIADGSFLEMDGNDMLDSTQEPENFVNISADDEPTKADKETVFKTVDKMFLAFDKSGNTSKDSNNLNIPERCNSSYCSNKSAHSSSKSKEAIEIITTLSEILNNDAPTEKQKSEGQSLLSSLAEIFLSSTSTKSPSCVLEDSGHSSIESEPAMTSEGGDCYEVLDLRKKSCSETNISQPEETCLPLDLSMKAKSEKSFVSPKILPPKYNKNAQKSLINPQCNRSLASNCSFSSNESKNLSDSSTSFKPKKPATKIAPVKRGPMKAVLPVDNMARRKSINNTKITPKRSETKSNPKLKKTSTPINETNLKPMAQSTPDNPKTERATSPVARPNVTHDSSSKTLQQKLNYSGSNLSLNKNLENKNKGNSFLRRGSSGELRKPQSGEKILTRSYSLGEKTGFSNKIGSSIKQTSQRNSFSYSKTESRGSAVKENRNKSIIKPPVGKRVNKENLH